MVNVVRISSLYLASQFFTNFRHPYIFVGMIASHAGTFRYSIPSFTHCQHGTCMCSNFSSTNFVGGIKLSMSANFHRLSDRQKLDATKI